ncbi:MAG TPA: DUF3592 domain-containing protein [Actinospica sp.]|nr:DUF3592 domain-containing protein [Actinospica sp.]
MNWHGYLTLWCAGLGAAALVGYGRSLAGMTRAQRSHWLAGRIDRVDEPRHGSSPADGIPVVVSFRDPSTGQEHVVTNDGTGGERIGAAWPGREIGVNYPRGRPHDLRFTSVPVAGGRGLGWPNAVLFLLYASLVVAAAIEWGWPWALIGFCGPWAVSTACYLPQSLRDARRNTATLESMVAVPGRVVAVLKKVSTDGEGSTVTSHMPVVVFSTLEGTTVTAYCDSGVPDPAAARGRELVIHYAPADPADCTADIAAARRSRTTGISGSVLGLIATSAATIVGVALL